MESLLTKIDWNAFQYIFSANARSAFQQLTEQMFCFEFDRPYGVYRYYNQPYIETMPIQVEDTCVGFQAKYFDGQTRLPDKRDELIESISGAYKKYPGINKIIFYINKEIGMSTSPGQEKPAYMQSILENA